MNLNIAVCDDIKTIRQGIVAECEHIREAISADFEIFEYDNIRDLKEELGKIDILLLDIEIGEESGIDVKNYIEENRLDIIIIFVTGYDSYVKESFGLNVIGFIDKSEVKEKLATYLTRAVEIKAGNSLTIEGLNIRTVKYVQSDGTYVRLVSDDSREALHRVSMKEMEDVLKEYDFCRAHRSYIINFRYVKKIITVGHGKRYVVIDDKRLKVSDKYVFKFLERYKEYCIKELKKI